MSTKLTVGDAAPDFTLIDTEETELSKQSLLGQWVVLYFYPKDNTPGCTTQACDFTSALDAFTALDAVVLGVSPDSPKSHRRFIDKHSLRVRLLCDPEHTAMVAYGAWGTKKNYGREYEGVIRSTALIDPEGNLAHFWTKVRAKGHAEVVRATLAELQG